MVNRPSLPDYWLRVAQDIARRGTCPRLQVGAVIISADGVIVSTGYNGSPRGLPHCADVGCLIEPETGRCKRTVHAEANAIIQAGPKAWGGSLYCTHQPCSECSNLILNAGIRHVYFIHPYKSQSREIAQATDDNFFRAGVSFSCVTLGGGGE